MSNHLLLRRDSVRWNKKVVLLLMKQAPSSTNVDRRQINVVNIFPGVTLRGIISKVAYSLHLLKGTHVGGIYYYQ
jgi:hypothetical protein